MVLIGLVKAVRHWRPYLWMRPFVVQTDHYTLKFLLDQRLSTIPQHAWVSKLFANDFSVEYLLGKINTVADALSRCDKDYAMVLALSSLTFALFDDLRREMTELMDDICLLEMIRKGKAADKWSVVNDLTSTSVASMCLPCPPCGWLFLPQLMGRAMRASRRPYIDYELHSTI
jgi:hypothetical protein